MDFRWNRLVGRIAVSIALAMLTSSALGQIRLPAIDPSGNRIFLPAPNSTTLINPFTPRANSLQSNGGLLPQRPGIFGQGIFQRTPPTNPQNGVGLNNLGQPTFVAPPNFNNAQAGRQGSTGPAFQTPPTPPPCGTNAPGRRQQKKHFVPDPRGIKTRGQRGQILMTPSRIIAPVGSEVVVLAGICGGDGYFSINQPLEWILSNDSVGQIIEVGGQNHAAFNQLVPPTSEKVNGQYARGRTGLKRVILTRGTPTPCDDIELAKGQTFISLSSASEGTTYVTGLAPNAEGWDRRRATTKIRWVDALWATPVPSRATAGTVFPLTTVVNRSSDGKGVKDWKIKYTIVGGAAAEFAPSGSKTATTTTNDNGQGIAQLRQPAGQFEPGTTQIRVDIIRPPLFNEPELLVESGLTTVTWSAPALTIRAIADRAAQLGEPFNYRVEVTNPGDQLAQGVVVRTKNIDADVEYISSDPKPVEFGRQLEWQLGDIPPNSPPRVINVQFKSNKRGNAGLCFEVASDSDRLRTEACSEIEIAVPCIDLKIDGPETAIVGQDVVYTFELTNQCDQRLEDIDIVLRYGEGLLAAGRSNPIQAKVDALDFGQQRKIDVVFNVLRAGTLCFDLLVDYKDGSPVEAKKCLVATNSRQPSVRLDLQNESPITVGQRTLVNATVTNNGNAPIDSVILTNRFSNSLQATQATEDFPFTRISDTEYTFSLGRIEPGEQKQLDVEYEAIQADGNASSSFALTSTSNINQTQSVNFRIEPGAGNRGFADPGNGTGSVDGDGRVRPDGSPNFGLDGGGGNSAGQNSGGNTGGIGIPSDDGRLASDALDVQVETVTELIKTVGSVENLPNQGEVQFLVRNKSAVNLQNVAISFFAPPGLAFVDSQPLDQTENLPIVRSDASNQRYDYGLRRTLRPGEAITMSLTFQGQQPGQYTVEVVANAAGREGSVRNSDSIAVRQ